MSSNCERYIHFFHACGHVLGRVYHVRECSGGNNLFDHLDDYEGPMNDFFKEFAPAASGEWIPFRDSNPPGRFHYPIPQIYTQITYKPEEKGKCDRCQASASGLSRPFLTNALLEFRRMYWRRIANGEAITFTEVEWLEAELLQKEEIEQQERRELRRAAWWKACNAYVNESYRDDPTVDPDTIVYSYDPDEKFWPCSPFKPVHPSTQPDEACGVCKYESLREGDPRQLPCGHVFHLECVEDWVIQKENCPYCRKKIKLIMPPYFDDPFAGDEEYDERMATDFGSWWTLWCRRMLDLDLIPIDSIPFVAGICDWAPSDHADEVDWDNWDGWDEYEDIVG